MDDEALITAKGLTKSYDGQLVLDNVSFEVQRGEVFGLIGPNGAGKTTTMECLEGIRTPDQGTVEILGIDPHRSLSALQDRIGVQLQQAELQKRIKVWEAVDLMAGLYTSPVDGKALLEQLGLSGKLNARFMSLSGGQKQRLFIALALINDPEIVFLDELTTGLDPQARRVIWNLILNIRAGGKTVFLTTHLMEEAERLCDRVAIIDHGKVIAIDTPQSLVKEHCPEVSVSFRCAEAVDEGSLRSISSVWPVDVGDEGRVSVVGQGESFVSDVIQHLAAKHIRVSDFHTDRRNLEDVFLKLTGHSVRE